MHLRLLEAQMSGLAALKIGSTGNRRARREQIGGVKLLGAVFTLITAGAHVFAIGAGAFDKPVQKEAAIGGGVELGRHRFVDQLVGGGRSTKCCVADGSGAG